MVLLIYVQHDVTWFPKLYYQVDNNDSSLTTFWQKSSISWQHFLWQSSGCSNWWSYNI